MISAEHLAQIEVETAIIEARGSIAGNALAIHVRTLIAEVRRLQAENVALKAELADVQLSLTLAEDELQYGER